MKANLLEEPIHEQPNEATVEEEKHMIAEEDIPEV